MAREYSPTDQAKRYERSEANLTASGGRRVNVRLRGGAAKALARLQKRWKTNQTEVINKLLEES